MFPNYISELLKAYFEMSSEDRRKILDERYFNTNPLTCPVEYLPYLALEVGVNIDGLDEEDARVVIEKAILANNKAGTVGCVKENLGVFGYVKIYEKENFIFDVDFSLLDREITKDLYERSLKIIEKTKNVRSVLGEFLLSYKTSANLNLKVGNMGESRSEAEMIDGFTNSATAFAYPAIGAMGEATAIAIMEE